MIIYPNMVELRSNHRFYKLDIKSAIDHSNTNYKTTTLTSRRNVKRSYL